MYNFDLDEDTQLFKTVSFKFHRLFNMPPEEKLVNYYSCRYVSVDKSAAWGFLHTIICIFFSMKLINSVISSDMHMLSGV